MQALPEAKPWEEDPFIYPLPWRTERCSLPVAQKLRIGFVLDDGVVKPQPPVTRAVKEVITALRAAGHEGECTGKRPQLIPCDKDLTLCD